MRTFASLQLAAGLLFGAAVSANSPITLTDALKRTLARNPALVTSGYQIKVQEGRLLQASLRPNAELGLLVEDMLGTGDLGGFGGTETTLSMAWVLERGKRERRTQAARSGLGLLETEAEINRLNAAAQTARLFIGCLAYQERVNQIDEAVRLAEQTVAAIAHRVAAGRTPEADLIRAQAETARARLSRVDVEHKLLVSIHKLAAQWGDSNPEFAAVSGDIGTLPELEPFEDLLARVDQNPDLARYLSETRLREAELQLAQAEAKPNWRITAGVRHLEASNDQAIVAGITMPLPRQNRNQGRIAQARAQIEMAGAAGKSSRIRIETSLFAHYQELEHSLHRAEVIRDEILPLAKRALTATQKGYEAGSYGYFALRAAQVDVLNTQADLIESSIEAHQSVIEIERLTGTVITRRAESKENLP